MFHVKHLGLLLKLAGLKKILIPILRHHLEKQQP